VSNERRELSEAERMNRNGLYAGVAAVAVLGLLGGSVWFALNGTVKGCGSSSVAGGAGAIGGPFTLIDETGKTVTEADVLTQPALVYFGYTFCPDVCPLDAARNAEAVDILAQLGHEVLPVFITIDPERDTPEVLADYTDYLHPNMLGLTGSPEQVKAASQAYRTYYKKQESEDEFYLMDHTALTYLMLPDAGFVEFFKRDATSEQIANTASCFIDHER
jgi:protein SCO1/2